MLKEMIEYTALADHKIIAVFKTAGIHMPEAESLFSHTLNAQHIWAKRVLEQEPDVAVWALLQPEQFEAVSNNNFVLIRKIFEQVPLDREIQYSTASGESYSGQVKDILFHLVNHSTYHRAQISSIFKKNGISPPITDYIMLKRIHQL